MAKVAVPCREPVCGASVSTETPDCLALPLVVSHSYSGDVAVVRIYPKTLGAVRRSADLGLDASPVLSSWSAGLGKGRGGKERLDH